MKFHQIASVDVKKYLIDHIKTIRNEIHKTVDGQNNEGEHSDSNTFNDGKQAAISAQWSATTSY